MYRTIMQWEIVKGKIWIKMKKYRSITAFFKENLKKKIPKLLGTYSFYQLALNLEDIVWFDTPCFYYPSDTLSHSKSILAIFLSSFSFNRSIFSINIHTRKDSDQSNWGWIMMFCFKINVFFFSTSALCYRLFEYRRNGIICRKKQPWTHLWSIIRWN